MIDENIIQSFAYGFNILQSDVHELARSKGWWDSERSVGESIALMHSELSETLEVYRKNPDAYDDKLPGHRAAAVELADVIIRIMDFAGRHGLDVAEAILAKHAFNATRPHKHGKNF